MGKSKEDALNVRKIRRLLHETKKIAENASLTGSLNGGAKIAVRQYNAIRNHLQDMGVIPDELFQELDEDDTNFDELGVTVAMLDGYLEEDEDDSGGDPESEDSERRSGRRNPRGAEHHNWRQWASSWGGIDPDEIKELKELGKMIRKMPGFMAGFPFSKPNFPEPPQPPEPPEPPKPFADMFRNQEGVETELRNIAEQLQREDLGYDERMELTRRIVELTRR